MICQSFSDFSPCHSSSSHSAIGFPEPWPTRALRICFSSLSIIPPCLREWLISHFITVAHVPFTSLLSKHWIYSETRLVFSLASSLFLNPEGFCCWFCVFFCWLQLCLCFRIIAQVSERNTEFFFFSSLTSKPFSHLCPYLLSLLSLKCCVPLPAIVSNTKMKWLGCVKALADTSILSSPAGYHS